MRELSISFEEKLCPFEGNASGEAFSAFSPTGKVPCLRDEELVVWDSLAIVEYLAEREDGVWPEAPTARAWARSASAEMHSGFAALRDQCSMHCGFRIRLHAMSPELKQDINRIDAIWCEGLQRFGGPFLAGDKFTAVDAFYAPVAFRVQTYDLALSEQAVDYAKRLLALDSMRNWEVAALQEPWRESAHEEAALRAGVLLADHRHR